MGQRQGQIFVLQQHVVGNLQFAGGKVPDRFDAAVHHLVAHGLGRAFADGDDADLDAVVVAVGVELAHGQDLDLASQMDGCLLLAFEPGYKTIPGIMAQDITTWGEMKQVFRELKKPEVQAVYKAVIVDTIDIAADRCKKYICQQNGIEDLGDLGCGKGWTKFKDEFNEVFRGLTQLGYAVFFIGHHKAEMIDNPDGTKTQIVRPQLSGSTSSVIAGMADIYGYAHQKYTGELSVLT